MAQESIGCKRSLNPIAVIVGLFCATQACCVADEIVATVDTYGLITVRRETVLEAAGIAVGSPVPSAEEISNIKQKLERIPAVCEADLSVIRVRMPGAKPGAPARPTVYIGVRESGSPKVLYRSAPTGNVELPKELVTLYREYERNWREAFRHGNNGEDFSNGYALSDDQATRAIQKQFIPLAIQHFERLVEVLQNAESAEQRRIAAAMLAFASDKPRIATELAVAARDPNARVRNNALRALGVILDYAHQHPELQIDPPIEPYLDLLDSVEWTDRNKAMFVLLELTESGNDAILTRLAERSLPALVEMARWNTEGHASMAYLLVGRVARIPESELSEGWRSGNRESILARATESATKEKPVAK
jgi:hypothetical protein